MTNKEKQIRKLVKDFIKQIDSEIKIKKGKEFYAQLETNEIFIVYNEMIKPNKDDKYHIQVLSELGYNIDIGTNTFYLLHELGHLKTYKQYGKNKQKILSDYINQSHSIREKDFLKSLRLYKNIKMEKDADLFAYKYYKNNYNFVKDFDRKLKELSK
jgi:Zn-dependent peptidase ImmA (M78 family)